MTRQPVNSLRTFITRFISGTAALLLIVTGPTPVYVYADEACSPVVSAPTGVQKPTGADSVTYTYNECTGLWENPHFTWNPATYEVKPKVEPVYTYNALTKKWDSAKWIYAPATAQWFEDAFSVDTPPAGAKTVGGPVVKKPAATNTTPSGSENVSNSNNADVNAANDASVHNLIEGSSASGNAGVTQNMKGGSATSGDAEAIANVLNLLQSNTNLGTEAATFVTNIDGDVQGDLIIDPSALQPALDGSINNNGNLNVNVENNGQIVNDLTLTATTGDAIVAENTEAGGATSGNARAVANVINMINSMISANRSFVGVVNINGNFNGNILMPQKFLDNLIASNAPSATINVSQETVNNIAANLSNESSVQNNVTSSAMSGTATSTANTNAAGATSGNAKTNVTIFDITGFQITGGNTMLVFVNVTGKWVGVLMNAPAGSTAAAFGGSTNATNTNNVNATVASKGSITNNIDVSAESGDATVARNTTAGAARSGDAETSVNLANIKNSSINLTGWFGILFINVFGNWNGNFGVATTLPPAGAAATIGSTAEQAAVLGFKASTSAAKPAARTTTQTHTFWSGLGDNPNATFASDELTSVVGDVMAASAGNAGTATKKVSVTPDKGMNMSLVAGASLISAAILLVLVDLVRSRRALVR